MQINLLSLIVMVILGIIVNYSMLKLLTEKVYPPGNLSGKPGKMGKVGLAGTRGLRGEKGNMSESNSGPKGLPGKKGDAGSCTNFDVLKNDNSEIIGGCLPGQENWEIMGLTSYMATKKDVCIFGYKYNKNNGMCESPIMGNTNKKDDLRKYKISDWEPKNSNSNSNCNYNKDVINSLNPRQFEKWAKLMSDRGCPGVPKKGKVAYTRYGNQITADDKYKICDIEFIDCKDCSGEIADQMCRVKGLTMANAQQVNHAYKNCDLDTKKHGRIKDKFLAYPFAYPVKDLVSLDLQDKQLQSKITSSYTNGVNLNASNGNDGVFCVPRDAPKLSEERDKVIKDSSLPNPPPSPPTQAPLPSICSEKDVRFVGGAKSNSWERDKACKAAGDDYVLASPKEVFDAWDKCKLSHYAFGKMTDGKAAVTVQSKTGWANRGPNLHLENGNQGQFCVKGKNVSGNRIYLIRNNKSDFDNNSKFGLFYPPSVNEITAKGGSAKAFNFTRYSADKTKSLCYHGWCGAQHIENKPMAQRFTKVYLKGPANYRGLPKCGSGVSSPCIEAMSEPYDSYDGPHTIRCQNLSKNYRNWKQICPGDWGCCRALGGLKCGQPYLSHC